jgi:hypothetical protein
VTVPLDVDGHAELLFHTVYYDLFFLPLREMIIGKHEKNPVGLWLQAMPPSDSPADPQAFIVRDIGGVPTLVRLTRIDGTWHPSTTAGTIQVGERTSSIPRCYVWQASVPLTRWSLPTSAK